MNATGDIDSLVKSLTGLTGDHKLISIIVMYLIGLIVTLPESPKALAVPIKAIRAIVSKPIDAPKGINNEAIIGTLGPTAGLNIDGQHDHIRDTCIPNFLFYNVPLMTNMIMLSINIQTGCRSKSRITCWRT
jgi:predicted histidine transporter YuiF (NhaC family)